MRQLELKFLFLLITGISQGQGAFDLNKISFCGLEFHTTKAKILNSFGAGKRIETDYECGFFTNDQVGGPYYQLIYAGFNYIGSDKEEFWLQSVVFDLEGTIKINYGEKELSAQTTKEDFVKILYGDKKWERLEGRFDEDVLIIYAKDSDDGAKFIFKNGRLLRFDYWTPC